MARGRSSASGAKDTWLSNLAKSAPARTVAAISVLIALLIGACAEGESSQPPTPTTTNPSRTATATPIPTSTPAPSLTLAAVGDIMLARSTGQLVLAEGPEAPFAGVAAMLRSADITVGNLESAISTLGEPQEKKYTFRAPPIAVESLRLADFDVVAQSNNHALDFGREAMLDTLARLRAVGIEPVGAGANVEEARAPALVDANGLRVGFLSYTNIPSPAWAASGDRPGVAWLDLETMAAGIEEATAQADVVAVFLHFGVEESLAVTDAQREIARAAIDAGATLVIGSHPHVLQEVEEYEGGLIAYSLGNFVFDGFEDVAHANESAILFVELTSFGLVGWSLAPVVIVDGLPVLAEGRSAR